MQVLTKIKNPTIIYRTFTFSVLYTRGVVKVGLSVGEVKGHGSKVEGHGPLPVLFRVDHFRFFFRVDHFRFFFRVDPFRFFFRGGHSLAYFVNIHEKGALS